jgi:hypothetical protein
LLGKATVGERAKAAVLDTKGHVASHLEGREAKRTEVLRKMEAKVSALSRARDNADLRARDRAYQAAGDWSDEENIRTGGRELPRIQADLQKRYDRAEWNFNQSVAATNKLFDPWTEREGVLSQHWKAFCVIMKSKMNVQGQNYSDLTLAGVFPRVVYRGVREDKKPGGAVECLIQDVLSNNVLKDGSVACISLWPGNGASKSGEGHMVCVMRVKHPLYLLFDPNFGVYAFVKENLEKAFVYLFAEAYPDLEDCGDAGDYEVNHQVTGEYLVFSA